MFDLGWSELLLIAAVALIVIGPKDLPQAIRTVTQVIRKLRGMARDFQSGLDDLAREAGVDDIKRDLTEFKQDYDPAAALENIAKSEGGSLDTAAEPPAGNRIQPPAGDERPDPPDLTPGDFGAPEPTVTAKPDNPAADAGPPASKDGGTA